MQTKLKRGQKFCKSCGGVNAARQRVCKFCEKEFICKNTPIKNEIQNWKSLQKNDYIKVIQGSGPYFIAKHDSEDAEKGERICMGYTGVYRVIGVDENGITAYGATNKNGGYSYLYMGPRTVSSETGIFLEPYRLKKVKNGTNRNRNNIK